MKALLSDKFFGRLTVFMKKGLLTGFFIGLLVPFALGENISDCNIVVGIGELAVSDIPDQYRDSVIACYEKSALSGDAVAQYNLALLYANGKFKIKNLQRAAALFKVAADNGHVLSSYNYAVMFEQGEGVEVDYSQAKKYYKIAAEGGHVESQVIMGQLAELDGDYVRAADWYEKAIRSKNAEAYFYLGAINLRGYLGAPNIKKACGYISESERLGFSKAIEFNKIINRKGVSICQAQ